MQKFTVLFDDGTVVEAQVRSRDLVKLEEAGIDLEAVPPMRGSYLLAHAAMQRMARLGEVSSCPETVEELMDIADLETDAEPDPKD